MLTWCTFKGKKRYFISDMFQTLADSLYLLGSILKILAVGSETWLQIKIMAGWNWPLVVIKEYFFFFSVFWPLSRKAPLRFQIFFQGSLSPQGNLLNMFLVVGETVSPRGTYTDMAKSMQTPQTKAPPCLVWTWDIPTLSWVYQLKYVCIKSKMSPNTFVY